MGVETGNQMQKKEENEGKKQPSKARFRRSGKKRGGLQVNFHPNLKLKLPGWCRPVPASWEGFVSESNGPTRNKRIA